MRTTLSLLILLILVKPANCTSEKPTIMVRPQSEVTVMYPTLGDIATVQCADQALAVKLSNAQVCSSPSPGKTRKLTRDQVIVAILHTGMKLDAVALLCPTEITLTRSSAVITGQSLYDAAKEFVLANNNLQGTIQVEPGKLPYDQTVQKGKIELKVKSGSRQVRKGSNSIPVEIMIDDKVHRTVYVQVTVKVLAKVLVSTQPILRGTELSFENIALQEFDITNLPSDLVMEEPAASWVATMTIPQGTAIRKGWIAQPPAVKSGDAVLVVVHSGMVKITNKGTAIQDGRSGDKIRVRLQDTLREVRGEVTEPGIVMISVPASSGRRS